MNNEQSLVSQLDHLVQGVKTNVQLYRAMYSGVDAIESIGDFARLPTLSKATLAAERLEKTLTDPFRLCLTRNYDDSPPADDYMPRLLSYEDALDEYQVLNFFIQRIDKENPQKVFLIADERHVYPIADLGHQLAYYEWPLAAFIIREQNIGELQSFIASFEPTIVFLDAQQELPEGLLPGSVQSFFSFNQGDESESSVDVNASLQRSDILRDAWLGPLAIRFAGEPHYTFDPRFFYFESSANGALLVTSFINRLQPVIRYELPYCGTLTGTNTFVLNGPC